MSKLIKKISRKREEKIASDIGGRRHSGSGSQWYRKSDASNTTFQFEDKFTDKIFFTLSLSKLKKIEVEALKVDKIPVFRFGFLGQKDAEYIVMRFKDFQFIPNGELINHSTAKIETYKRVSVRLYSDVIKTILVLSPSLYLEFSENYMHYLIIRYDVFLNLKDRIEKGEPI